MRPIILNLLFTINRCITKIYLMNVFISQTEKYLLFNIFQFIMHASHFVNFCFFLKVSICNIIHWKILFGPFSSILHEFSSVVSKVLTSKHFYLPVKKLLQIIIKKYFKWFRRMSSKSRPLFDLPIYYINQKSVKLWYLIF